MAGAEGRAGKRRPQGSGPQGFGAQRGFVSLSPKEATNESGKLAPPLREEEKEGAAAPRCRGLKSRGAGRGGANRRLTPPGRRRAARGPASSAGWLGAETRDLARPIPALAVPSGPGGLGARPRGEARTDRPAGGGKGAARAVEGG
ncbi:unnamed protein product [Rangifer tarandus platyrhynchus]|uniref:Uncharacterized protein n=3 Tax=Rangifer tarandus platyrhynchus TaxID=3082113 RepID=A0AC59YK41_RANTA|nr:unnamed protein product [Rangifer tarandus platyrhynchus]CAI9696142.1 unnamed protein product [Rangifer tarandus platyrhynchus]